MRTGGDGMKTLKKILSLLAAMTLILSEALPAFAANHTYTKNESNGILSHYIDGRPAYCMNPSLQTPDQNTDLTCVGSFGNNLNLCGEYGTVNEGYHTCTVKDANAIAAVMTVWKHYFGDGNMERIHILAAELLSGVEPEFLDWGEDETEVKTVTLALISMINSGSLTGTMSENMVSMPIPGIDGKRVKVENKPNSGYGKNYLGSISGYYWEPYLWDLTPFSDKGILVTYTAGTGTTYFSMEDWAYEQYKSTMLNGGLSITAYSNDKAGNTYTVSAPSLPDIYNQSMFSIYSDGSGYLQAILLPNPPSISVTKTAQSGGFTVTLVTEEKPEPELNGGIMVVKTSDDGNVEGICFSVEGPKNSTGKSPMGQSGVINGYRINGSDIGDSSDWIGLCQQGDCTLIIRAYTIGNDTTWGSSFTDYSSSSVRGVVNSWYASSAPQALKSAACTNDAVGRSGSWPFVSGYAEEASPGIPQDGFSSPGGLAGGATTDIAFPLSFSEAASYCARNCLYRYEYINNGYGIGQANVSDKYTLPSEQARLNYGQLGIEGKSAWMRSVNSYTESFTGFSRSNIPCYHDMDGNMIGGNVFLGVSAQSASVRPAMWIKTEQVTWAGEQATQTQVLTWTDRYGYAPFTGLQPGTYTVEEFGDWTKYRQQPVQTATVTDDGTAIVYFNNESLNPDPGPGPGPGPDPEPEYGSVTVRKTSEDGVIYNLTFTLKGINGTTGSYTAVTDTGGTAVFRNIPFGTYLCEEAGDAKYKKLSREISLTTSNCDVVWDARNSVIKGGVEISKKSILQDGTPDGDASFGGISYGLYAASDNVYVYWDAGTERYSSGDLITTLVTDGTGSARLAKNILGAGRYVLRETDTGSSGYIRDAGWSYEFTVSSEKYDATDTEGNLIYRASQQDAPLTGGIRIRKYDSSTDRYEPFPGARFEGAQFRIINRSKNPVTVDGRRYLPGAVIMTVETNAAGEAETGEVLPYGTYGVKELKAPQGYFLSEEEVTVEVRRDGEVYVADIGEDADIRYIMKIDAATMKPLAGAGIKVTDKTDGAVYELVSDDRGRAEIVLLPNRKYTFQETSAPEGYVADRSIYSFETDAYGDPDIDLVIKNRKTGSAVITKTDALTGEPVAGAVITISSAAGETLAELTTDGFGRIYFDAAKYAAGSESTVTFKFKETAAPKGYYLNTDVYAFNILADGTVTGTTTLTDVPVGTVAIKKTDENGATLPGAKISVYTQAGVLVGQATTGSTGRIYFKPQTAGSYYFVEDAAPTGYVRNTEKHIFSITAAGVISGEVTLRNTRTQTGKTGDESHMGAAAAAAVILAGSAAVLTAAELRKRKRRKAD